MTFYMLKYHAMIHCNSCCDEYSAIYVVLLSPYNGSNTLSYHTNKHNEKNPLAREISLVEWQIAIKSLVWHVAFTFNFIVCGYIADVGKCLILAPFSKTSYGEDWDVKQKHFTRRWYIVILS